MNDEAKTRFYGDGGTIHSTTHIDVETRDGHVVAVWYRCAALPFVEISVDASRAKEMATMYEGHSMPEVHGLQLADTPRVVVNDGYGTMVADRVRPSSVWRRIMARISE